MSGANSHQPSTTGQAPRFDLRVARIARHLAVRGIRLRSTGTGWRIEPSTTMLTGMLKPATGRCRP